MDQFPPQFGKPGESFPPAIESPVFFPCEAIFSDLSLPPMLGNKEKERIARRLAGSDCGRRLAYAELCRRFGAKLTHPALCDIAEPVAARAGVRLDRDAKRRKDVLLQWFVEHWPALTSYLGSMLLANGEVAWGPSQ
jgi:hypothetical protein